MSEPDDRQSVSWSALLIGMILVFVCLVLVQMAAILDNPWMNALVFVLFLFGLWAFIIAFWRHRKHLKDQVNREPTPKESEGA